MILLLAVLAGFSAGFVRARYQGKRYTAPFLNHTWLIFVAFLLQAAVFYWPASRERIPLAFVPAFLLVSQALLLAFVWVNRTNPGFLILGMGLAMNFLVIAINGGMMPISPETASALAKGYSWESGMRFGWGKDIILARDETILWQLSDWLLTPRWFTGRYALSPGDLLIAAGAFWFMFVNKGAQLADIPNSSGVKSSF